MVSSLAVAGPRKIPWSSRRCSSEKEKKLSDYVYQEKFPAQWPPRLRIKFANSPMFEDLPLPLPEKRLARLGHVTVFPCSKLAPWSLGLQALDSPSFSLNFRIHKVSPKFQRTSPIGLDYVPYRHFEAPVVSTFSSHPKKCLYKTKAVKEGRH